MKRVITLLLALVLAATISIPVFAATQEENLEYIDTQKDVVFWVSWDAAKPTVTFIAPNGSMYDPNVETVGTTAIFGDKDLYYVVENARAGQWRIRYDKGSNTEIKVSVHDYQPGIYVETFTLDGVDGNRLPVHFRIGSDQGSVSYQYRISAMIDHTGVEKELRSGSATTGHDIDETLYLDGLSSYSLYILKLHVWYADGGTDIFDFCFSEPFAYTNTDLDEQEADFGLTIRPGEQTLLVSWEDLPWNADGVLVAVFENGAAEPTVFDTFDPDEQEFTQLAYDPAATQVAVEFTVSYDGVNADPIRKTMELSTFGVSIPDGEAFNSLMFPMSYQGFAMQPVFVTVNGYTTELLLDGSGDVNITLDDDWNELNISYVDVQGVIWQIDRRIFVDRIVPTLSMGQPYDGMHVDGNKVIISGTVLDCSTVTVNGQAVALGSGGAFSQEISLTRGANTVTVIAADALGNQSQYVATVISGNVDADALAVGGEPAQPGSLFDTLLGDGTYWTLIIISVLCLFIIGYALLFWRKDEEGEK